MSTTPCVFKPTLAAVAAYATKIKLSKEEEEERRKQLANAETLRYKAQLAKGVANDPIVQRMSKSQTKRFLSNIKKEKKVRKVEAQIRSIRNKRFVEERKEKEFGITKTVKPVDPEDESTVKPKKEVSNKVKKMEMLTRLLWLRKHV